MEDLRDHARRSYVASDHKYCFRGLFDVPSILKQSECLLFHKDTDFMEHHGEFRPCRERMEFLKFFAFFTQ